MRTSIRRLLAGEEVTLEGDRFTLDAIGITHPALEVVPLTMDVSGPMLLALSGEMADGTLFAAGSGLAYFRFAMEQVEKGLTRAGRSADELAYSVVALTCVDRNGQPPAPRRSRSSRRSLPSSA